MELSKLKNNNGTYLYSDEAFNTFSITLNFLTRQGNKTAAILDVLSIYLLRCNQVYKSIDDINLRMGELYSMDFDFDTDDRSKQKLFVLRANLVSMNVIRDDYSKEAFEFIRDMLKKVDLDNEEVLEISKRKVISYIDYYLSESDNYASTLYNEMVFPIDDMKYSNTVDKEYLEELVNSITLEDLKTEYNYIMNNYISGLVLGNINEEQFNRFVNCIDLTPTKHDLDYRIDVKTTEGIIEVDKDCEQTYIFVTYDFTNLTYAELRILEYIFNSSIGLCYKILREKYGLVYDSYAGIEFYRNKLYIYGETDASKKQKFIEAVDEIIECLNDRNTVLKYMEKAKEEIADNEYSLSEEKESLSAIINSNILKFYGDKNRDEVNKEIEEMTPEEIMEKTMTLRRKNVFVLRSMTDE